MTKGKKSTRAPFPIFNTFPTPLERTAYKFYNYLDNSLYPVRPFYFCASLAAIAGYYAKYSDAALLQLLPKMGDEPIVQGVRIGVASLLTAYIPVFCARSVLRHFYFTYKRWLFENPKKPSVLTKLWGTIRSALTVVPPRLMSCDAMLPSMSVPVLEETIERYLESIRNLHSKEELENIEILAREFLSKEGKKLQRYARLYSLFVDNYVTGFWEKYAYLYNRECLLVSSSVAHVDLFEDAPATQAVRAARIVYIEALSQLAIDRQTFSPLGNGLVCSRHYEKLYSVTRVPGEKIDRLVKHGIARHIVVIFNGGLYRVDFVDEKTNKMYTVDQLTDIFSELVAREGTEVTGTEGRVPALTHDKRPGWALNREKFFESIPKNKAALKTIETSAFIVYLSGEEDWDYNTADSSKLSNFMSAMITGNGANRWVDKSLNYIISKNARCGGTTEHSIADGSEFDHIFENFWVMDNEILEYPPLEEQLRRAKELDVVSIIKSGTKLAEKIEIDITPEMGAEIDRCYADFVPLRDDVDVSSLIFRDWGKGRIKTCGVSPDAFLQLAIQLANYRDQGRFVLTYEAASSRFFRDSRTETLRSVTDQSCAFVRAMVDEQKDNATCASLLKAAAEKQSARNRECMVNKGVDRHLFVLYVLSQGTGMSSPFLDHYIQQQWLLSTSHVPNVTNTMKEDERVSKSWLGASFGAVAKTGYGVCYRFAGNHTICAHISSYHSAENTNSHRFMDHLSAALKDMSDLFD